MPPGSYKLRAGGQRIEEPRAGCGQVKAPRPRRAQLVLQQAGGGGEEHIRRNRGHDDGFHVGAIDPALRQRACGSLESQVRGGHALVHNVAFANPGALDDPLVGSLDHLLEVIIGQQPWRRERAQRGDLGTGYRAAAGGCLSCRCGSGGQGHAFSQSDMVGLRAAAGRGEFSTLFSFPGKSKLANCLQIIGFRYGNRGSSEPSTILATGQGFIVRRFQRTI